MYNVRIPTNKATNGNDAILLGGVVIFGVAFRGMVLNKRMHREKF